jgi:prepilin-type N-terminal cleavage/methylation domain-containing protein
MTPHMTPKKSLSQSGFTLLELLLVMGVAAMLLMGVIKITSSWVQGEISAGGGQQLQRVAIITQKYIEANWSDPALTATTDALNAGGKWADLKSTLEREGLLNASGELRSTLNVPLRISYSIDTTGPRTIYRGIVFTVDPVFAKRALDSARQAGTFGGTLALFPNAANAFGAFGQWTLPVGKLTGMTCTPAADKSCLIALISHSVDTLCGSFLYRNDVETTSECVGGNTMNTDLLMNNNNITNAGTINTQNINVNGNTNLGVTNVGGVATFNQKVMANGGVDVNNGMTVSGQANFSGNVTMASGTLNVTDLNASTIQSSRIEANNLNIANMTVTNGSMAIEGDIGISGDVTVAGGGAEIIASTLGTGSIDTYGTIQVGKVDVQNVLEVNGQLDVVSGTVIADHLVARKCVQIRNGGTYDDYGNCN